MIIQCEKCLTKFRLDDSRVKEKGVKVRCTKCKHVFTVRKEEPEAEPFEPDNTVAVLTPSDEQGEISTLPPEDQTFVAEPVTEAPGNFGMFEDAPPRSEAVDFSSFETSSFDASSISFESEESPAVNIDQTIAVEPASTGGEVDFSSFDFGDSEVEAESTPIVAVSGDSFSNLGKESVPAPPKKETPQGLDFSDDDMFGEVVPSVPEVSNAPIKFDFDDGSFAESMDMGGQDLSGKGGLFSLDSSSDAPFSLGEIDFGDELTSVAVQQVNPDDLKPSQQILFAPLAEAQEKSSDDELTRAFLGEGSAEGQQELPPLSISSRRKQNPLFSGLIAVISILVISLLGYFGYTSLSAPKEIASQDSGKISIRAVQASYVKNDKLGELLVVSGEALNEYSKSRAALQVEVTVFDATGQSVATKSAYCGNPLTKEQLESLPLDKIEAAMSNQFGDSLANMEVASGKSIPFVVVLAKLPKGAKDFGVQSVGSTVATGKQQ